MRELDRDPSPSPLARAHRGVGDARPRATAILGAGRLGRALAAALRAAGREVRGPLGRGADPADAEVVLLCVPDAEIAAGAAAVGPGPLVGHCSGVTGLDVLGAREGFSLHPLMTVTDDGADFAGAGCAVDGTSPASRAAARDLALALGMRPVALAPADRPAYHAAASVASNFLVTLEAAAERLAATAGLERADLVPLVRATVDNWARLGGERALTGPLARGDEATVTRQRAAVAERAPDLLAVFDALAGATRALARAHDPGMRTVRTVAALREALAPARAAGRTIGLVPTMGAFHAGHRALMRAARERCDVVVVSLFVNPTQFGPGEDLAAYPRDERRDAAIAADEGVDVLFAPTAAEVYPRGCATTVRVRGPLTETLEGAARGADHFDGVTTVVAKLFAMAEPDVAFFGAKDAQQALVVRRMTADLDLGVEIDVRPTVREPDGLAASSRNAYLDSEDRARAVALRRGLEAARAAIGDGERDPSRIAASARAAMAEHDVTPEYLAIVSPDDLAPVERVDGEVLVAMAARVGSARLIDNDRIDPADPELAPSRPVDREAATQRSISGVDPAR